MEVTERMVPYLQTELIVMNRGRAGGGRASRWRHARAALLPLVALSLGLAGCSRNDPPTPVERATALVSEPESTVPRETRPVYRHSVIPGGLRSVGELREAIASDPAVREHFAGIHPEKVRFARLDSDQMAYVSYRTNNRIYWTTRRVRLRAGETVLSDGNSVIRGRCGNRVSLTPLRPFLPPESEPSTTSFDIADPPDLTDELAYAVPPPAWEPPAPPLEPIPVAPVLPERIERPPMVILPPRGGGIRLAHQPPPPPTPVPEPSTLSLVFVALLFGSALAYRRRVSRRAEAVVPAALPRGGRKESTRLGT